MDIQQQKKLCTTLYRRLYGPTMPTVITKLVEDGLTAGTLPLSKEDAFIITKINASNYDAIAIETALRHRNATNFLTSLFLFLSYLVEMSGHSQHKYIKPKGFISSVLACSFLPLLSVYLRLKGKFLLWRLNRA